MLLPPGSDQAIFPHPVPLFASSSSKSRHANVSSNPVARNPIARIKHADPRGGANALSRPARWPLALIGLLLLGAAGCGSLVAQSHNAEGVQLFNAGRFPEAQREFEEARQSDPSNPDAYYNLATVYHRAAKEKNRPADLAMAEQYYNQCLDQAERSGMPNHAECYRALAVLKVDQGQPDRARKLIEGWVTRQPRSADARIELARLEEEIGNRNAAKDRLQEALVIDPNSARALAALGKVREELGDPSQALANYQRSLSIDQHQPDLASRVAMLQSNLGYGAGTAAPAVNISGSTFR
jgi:tetratricopeptide (TPR) repeat protein